jgi:predicted AlkP superfamily pyrophosphatase or phosphodiesterase
MRTLILSAIFALAATQATAAPPRPKLIVAISVDQFSADLYQRYRAGFTGGMKRLSSGMVFTTYQSHAATETCPGHSTILTGHHPAATGIVANEWLDRKTWKPVYCVSVPGADPDARGPQNLRVDTLGDWLKKASPRSQVVSISGKDRAAIMLGGHHADAVYWWTEGRGFTTSSYAGPATAEVLAPADTFNQALFASWRAQPPQLWPASLPATCAGLVKTRTYGKLTMSGEVPPEQARGVENGADFLSRKDFQNQQRVSPSFDPMTIDFVRSIIDARRLGRGPATDLLAVSLSTTDYIGHRYGPGGAEMCVQMAALDRAVGALLAKLDSLHVRYVVALTADHGGSDAPERLLENGIAARRLDTKAFVASLNDHLETTLGLQADPIAYEDAQQLMIKITDEPRRSQVRDAALAWLKSRSEVAQVYTASQVAAAVPVKDEPVDQLTVLERFHESYDPVRSGDIQIAYVDHTTLYMPRKPTDNISGHGSPWDYDRRVPMLFWWRGVAPQSRAEAVETVDIAPTLARIGRIPAPPVDGRCLPQVAGRCS